ncbi:peptidoglycan DD-metalloendopeptidase family protein [Hyphomicrobium sp. CS1BSMeth3]|uniref:murein hydrolase activator EnvC family protein n=1 Tax=Hyphomicrobium sp. CS1BSMeth3 TaxID=1892844 RepID=UPI0011601F32|nr:peptidoglycan DD-metalloendopeptidase family protein [Hyphomicrobium sp. CS1BSMeth3]
MATVEHTAQPPGGDATGRHCRARGAMYARGLRCASASAAILIVLAGALPAALAQGTGQARESLEKSRRELDHTRQRTKGLEKSMAEIQAERERLIDSLRETARIIHDSEARLTEIERHQTALAEQEHKIRDQLSERHGKIAVMLGAMQRMGRNPPPVMITRREDALQMVRSAMILARAFPELAEQATILAGRLSELVKVMEASKAQSAILRAETARHEIERTRIAQLIESRRQSLAEHQPALDAARKHAADTARRIDDLTTLIARLDAGPGDRGATPRADAPPTAGGVPAGLQPTPPMLSAEKPPAARPAGPGAPEGPAPAEAKAGPAMAQLLPSASQLASLAPGPMKPAIPFENAKGSLPLPAQGKRVLGFGDKTQFGTQSMGVVLETRHSAQVRSPSDGSVLWAGPFRAWGQLLIINAEGGYHVLLAGLSQIDVQVGQFVLAGEPVGLMSAAPRSQSAKAEGSAPVLYVEFRKDNRPIDPGPWWAVRS